jgi:hypothetical protein
MEVNLFPTLVSSVPSLFLGSLNIYILSQIGEMWWSPQEESLQQQAETAWGIFPGILAEPVDLAADLADPEAAPDYQPEEAMEAVEEDDPPPVFLWHVPEGAPDPHLAGGPPLLNGFHDHDLDGLAEVMGAAWVPFGQPPAGDPQPD